MLDSKSTFEPDWFSPPGSTILSAMHRRCLSADRLATLLELPLNETRSLLLGDRPIDSRLAEKLSDAIGGSVAFWRNRQTDYEESLQRCADLFDPNEVGSITEKLPLNELRKFGWINSETSKEAQALAFFGVNSPKDWLSRYDGRAKAVAFRRSTAFDGDPNSTLAWLRQAERLASIIPCRDWDREAFEKELNNLRSFTTRRHPSKFFPELVQRCAEHGVAVVFTPTPPRCTASGATFFTCKNKAVIVLSFRHLSDDQFWFSFFHEAAHLVLHDDKALFLEDESDVSLEAEKEANSFASNILVPNELRPELESLPARSKPIIRFAVRVGVSPGIVVGQMQHAGFIKHSQMNGLKRRYSKEELIASV